jgi:hypothetical protein
VSDPEAVMAAADRFEAAQAELAALSFDALTAPQALASRISWRPCHAGRPRLITGSRIG